MKVEMTLGVNSGLSVSMDGSRFFVDMFHNVKGLSFSMVTDERYREIIKHPDFQDPLALIYTHMHPDHCSEELTEKYLTEEKRVPVFGPTSLSARTDFNGQPVDFQVADLRFHFFRLPHEGRRFSEKLLYGFTVTKNGVCILFPSDCMTAAPELAAEIAGKTIDIAVMNFPWVSLSRGREYVENRIKPKHLVIDHLPFPEDDERFCYRDATKKAAPLYRGDVTILADFLQKVEFNIGG